MNTGVSLSLISIAICSQAISEIDLNLETACDLPFVCTVRLHEHKTKIKPGEKKRQQ